MELLIRLVKWYDTHWSQYAGSGEWATVYSYVAAVSLIIALVSILVSFVGNVGKQRLAGLIGQQIAIALIPMFVEAMGWV